MKNMAEFKVDVQEEIKVMSGKITKLEDIMTDFIGKLNAALPQAAAEAEDNARSGSRQEILESRKSEMRNSRL